MADRRTALSLSVARYRQSIAPGSEAASAHKRPPKSGKDRRDLHNKSAQKQTKQKVIKLLAELQYPEEAVSDRSVDSLIHWLRSLPYPYVPPKSSFQSCSSPVFAPTMLGLLDWLAERIILKLTFQKRNKSRECPSYPQPADTPPRNIIKVEDPSVYQAKQAAAAKFARFAAGYSKYMHHGDAAGEHVVKLFKDDIESVRIAALEEVTQKKQEIAEIEKARDEVQNLPDLLSGPMNTLAMHRRSEYNISEQINEMHTKLAQVGEEIGKVDKLKRDLLLKTEACEREELVVQRKIQEQPITVEQGRELQESNKVMTQMLETKREMLKQSQELVDSARSGLFKRLLDIQGLMPAVMRGFTTLKLCPIQAKKARMQDYEIKVNPDLMNNLEGEWSNLFTQDLEGKLGVALGERKKELLSKTEEYRNNALRHARRIERQEAHNEDAKQQIEQNDQELSKLQADIEAIRERIASLREESQRFSSESDAMMRESEEWHRKLKEREVGLSEISEKLRVEQEKYNVAESAATEEIKLITDAAQEQVAAFEWFKERLKGHRDKIAAVEKHCEKNDLSILKRLEQVSLPSA